jgi:hypothetical protein
MQIITPSQALDKVIHSLGLNSKAMPSLLKTQIMADYLRHTLLTLSHSATTVQPVFITTLLNQVQRQLMPLWPEIFKQTEEKESLIRRILKQLEQIREVADLGKGYWLPTPLRLVRLPSSQILLIGGMDTKTLQAHLGNILYSSTGLARRIKSTEEAMCLVKAGIEWQRFEDWLGEDTDIDLRTWTTHLLEKAKKRLKSSGSEITEFDVYLPKLRDKKDWQNRRWIPARQLVTAPEEMVLCRFQNTYYLSQLKGEKPVCLAKEISLSQLDQNVEPCKLLYGLDLLYDRPTRVEFEHCNDNEDKLIFRNWLPTSQQRLLRAVGHEVHGKLPLVYQFSKIYRKDIFEHIQKLGIQIEEKRTLLGN